MSLEKRIESIENQILEIKSIIGNQLVVDNGQVFIKNAVNGNEIKAAISQAAYCNEYHLKTGVTVEC